MTTMIPVSRKCRTPNRASISIFLNASLARKSDRLRNQTVVDHLQSLGFTKIYLPQHEIPIETKCKPSEILRANEQAVKEASIVICILDNVGFGVVYELTLALQIGKPVFVLRPINSTQVLGKMIEGVLDDRVPARQKASTVAELGLLLVQFVESAAED